MAEFFNFKWPQGVLKGHEESLESVVEKYSLDIPKTKDGKRKKLTGSHVGSALVFEYARTKVLEQSRAIFNIVAV